jgi:hypothetical protein
MSVRTRIRASFVTALAFLAFVGVMATKGHGRPVAAERPGPPVVNRDDLEMAARTRVFFEHQSVGMNLLDGVSHVYAAEGGPVPHVVLVSRAPGNGTPVALRGLGGYYAHTFFGQNGDPAAKVRAFDERIRSGLGNDVDVAFMKFCFVDVTSDTDVDALFALYRDTIAALERDFPDVTFLKVTTPVTTERSAKSQIKAFLGHDDHMGPLDNAARERLNALMRREYARDHLFDLARLESTAPDGSRLSGSYRGQHYYALYPGYAADAGHLNAEGSARAAVGLVHAIARASEES